MLPSVLRFVSTFFISVVSDFCMMFAHNDVIDAGHNNRLFTPDTVMDLALLRLSHMQKGTCYVQICDKKKVTV